MSFYNKVAVIASFFVRRASSPTGTENALVVRNIPSGVQAVSITTAHPGRPFSQFNSINAVASGATMTIITYTVPPAKVNTLTKIEVSGSNIATYDIIINGSEFAKVRTHFGNLAGSCDLDNGQQLVAGDVLEVKVTNFRPSVGDFESRIELIEV